MIKLGQICTESKFGWQQFQIYCQLPCQNIGLEAVIYVMNSEIIWEALCSTTYINVTISFTLGTSRAKAKRLGKKYLEKVCCSPLELTDEHYLSVLGQNWESDHAFGVSLIMIIFELIAIFPYVRLRATFLLTVVRLITYPKGDSKLRKTLSQ